MPANGLEVRRVQILREDVARKIAAGEVIERPQSVLRELLDNALDSGATRIEVSWSEGGVRRIEVVDNGRGMSRDDLNLCWKPHATSKIVEEADLSRLTSLGFRGEALASIAACARLQIDTAEPGATGALRLVVRDQVAEPLRVVAGVPGTRVVVEDLFSSLPARKRFLKGASAESALCRRVFDEKAAGFPHVTFVLSIENQRRVEYAAQSEAERVCSVLGAPWELKSLIRWSAEGDGFRLSGYSVPPPNGRTDRKGLRVWANKRPLQEFSFVQAMSYAFEGRLPGGVFPWSVVFLEVDPDLVDFNVHPAKREARFRHLSAIHQAIVSSLRAVLDTQATFRWAPSAPETTLLWESPPSAAPVPMDRGRGRIPAAAWSAISEESPSPSQPETPGERAFRYVGQVLGVFLVAEVGDDLYLVDQHAAHERILYDAFRDHGGKVQPLLFPLRFRPDEDALETLRRQYREFSALGIELEPFGDDEFELKSLPATVAGQEKALISFLSNNHRPVRDVEKDLYATLSCRAAVMDGDPLDPQAARDLLRKAFALPHARCPHGRPIWTIISRRDLFALVGRILP